MTIQRDGDSDAEKRLQKALAYADDIIATLREPFLVVNSDLRVKTANRSFYDSFLVTKEDTENHLVCELGNGQWNIPRLQKLLDEVLSSRSPVTDYSVEHTFPFLGKKIMLLNARPFPPDSDHPELILLAIEDITEHRQVEIAMQISEIRYRRLFESARDGIFILDAISLKIIDANPYMTELLGYSHDEFLGKELWEIGFFGDKEASQKVYRELQDNGYVRYDHLPLESDKGKKAEVEFISNIYQVENRLVAQCNIRDISERSHLERKLKDQTTALAIANQKKDEFLAILGHELRNPLAALHNSIKLVQLGDEQMKTTGMEILKNQCEHITVIVDDIITVARAIHGCIEIKKEKVSLSEIIERAVQIAEPLIEKSHHKLEINQVAIQVLGDKIRLVQVFSNLLTNAAKYTKDKGLIKIHCSKEGKSAIIKVTDNGIGIERKDLNNIFDLCVRTDRAIQKDNGLGVGLTMAKAVVELHDGIITAHSDGPDCGSEFIVQIPLME